jgi:exonuclease III
VPNNVDGINGVRNNVRNDDLAVSKKFPNINFMCQNVCSLNISKPSKRTHSKIVSLTNCGNDIIFISDTRLNSDIQIAGVNNIQKKLQFLGYSLYHNSSKNNRGVAILLSNKLAYTVTEEYKDESCNILLLKLKMGTTDITVGSIYGPNEDDIEFYDQLRATVNRFNSDFVVIGGDWNATVDGRNNRNNLDILNTASIPSVRRSGWLNELMNACNLIDPYRYFFPDTPEFTYVPFAANATNRSRLDYYLISERLIEQCVNCRIPHNLSSLLFDHKPVFLYFRRSNPYKREVLNDVILKDVDIDQAVNLTAVECYINHLIPSDVVSDLRIYELKNIIGQVTVLQHEIADCRLSDATHGTDPGNIARTNNLIHALNETMDLLPALDDLQSMELSCSKDVFLEILIMAVKSSSLAHQQRFFNIKNAKKNFLYKKITDLKRDFSANVGEILRTERELNKINDDAMKEEISKMRNFEHLNSEKITP